jgi:hypothetical protein
MTAGEALGDMVISFLMVSNAAPGSTAAGLEAARLDSAADSNGALPESVAAPAPEALALASAIRHLKHPNHELAAPKRQFGESTGQAALKKASACCIRPPRQTTPMTSKK